MELISKPPSFNSVHLQREGSMVSWDRASEQECHGLHSGFWFLSNLEQVIFKNLRKEGKLGIIGL